MLNLTCFRCSTTYERPPTPGALPRYCGKSCADAVKAERRHAKAEDRQRARLEEYREQRAKWLAGRSVAA